ncbi:M23 family metallopeptidase [Natrinema salsiterrestre]|uniref:M23 family metallopeptidase n=1 Tax=Natrinema salsiterrestre TaxID=2950540 RepID=A0A9Q4KXR3_9EURY|nr:M23 family metallopeptidase [Natrinema salsiterrestre]MDF9745463.1 M23 family metallopeptidase [Natrinema salsiterrestre]
MTDRETGSESTTLATRARRRLRSFDPMHLAFLALLAIPGYVFEPLAALQFFEVFFLVFLWPFVAPLVDRVVRRGADEAREEPTDWIRMGTWREYAVWLVMIPVTFCNPFVVAQDLLQWLGVPVAFVRHRGSFPDAESYDQRVSYRLPFDGAWTVVNGSHEQEYSHSWFPVTQRYAYDFVVTDADGRTSPADAGFDVGSYYCYEEPVLAPADGVVVDVLDSDVEASRGGGFSHPLKRDIRGNYVVIQHAADEYSCLAHLVPGSLTVEPGERVARGREIARCGHSGNSSEPHLHFQLQDHPDFAIAAGLPIAFDDVAVEWPGATASIGDPRSDTIESASDRDSEAEAGGGPLADGTYRARSHITAGQRVAHVDGDGDDSRRNRSDVASETVDETETRPRDGRRAGTAALQRFGFGTCVGGVTAFFASIFVSWVPIAVLLGGGAAIGAAARTGSAILGGGERGHGSMGTVVGIGTVAAVVAWYGHTAPALGVGLQPLGAVIFFVGFLCYVALGEYDRLQLSRSFPDRTGVRPL